MTKKRKKKISKVVYKTGKILVVVSGLVIAGLWLGLLGEDYLIS